jgi:hypothetical protein
VVKGLAEVDGFHGALAQAAFGGLPPATYEEAATCFKKAIQLNPNRPIHYIELGSVYAQMRRKDEARHLITKGLNIQDTEKDDPPFSRISLAKLKSGITLPDLHRSDSELMRKFLSLLFVLLASIELVSAEPGTVIRVYRNSFVVRSTITLPSATHARGTSRIEHFVVTPATKFFINGNKGSFTDVKNGVHVNVKTHSGVDADRVDIVP